MSFAPVISGTGIIAPTYADILAYLKDSMRSIYGSDIYLEPDSQDGQFLAILATLIKDTNDSVIAAYNSFSPATAQGAGLSNVVKINGIRRLSPSNSTAIVRITGGVGVLINFGQVSDALQQRWTLPDLVEIPPAGFIDVTATAVEPGAILAGANTITTIVTPVRNWQSVTNPAEAVPGAPVENDATLRQRQTSSTSIPALSVVSAILGALENVIGVGRAVVYENDTGAPDVNGIPAHSICAVVEGGDAQTICAVIARYKTPGTGTYGDTSEVVTDGIALPITISYDALALVTVSALVYITAGAGFISTTEDLIAGSIAQWLNSLVIGQDSQLSKLWSPVNLMGDSATGFTGLTQQQLDVLSGTYNATDIYQAREDMIIEGGPFLAGVNVVHITNTADLAIGKAIALTLDNGTWLKTTITNKVGVAITMAANIPVGRSAVNGAIMYVSGDLTVAFNEATASEANNTSFKVV